ncbi:MAG: hypothetical protein AAF151_17265 [Cyanobacteria bacterium J06656_5]
MQTLTLKSHVGADGVLRLDIPIGLHNQTLDIVLVVQPAPEVLAEETVSGVAVGYDNPSTTESVDVLDNFLARTAGAWEGVSLVRDQPGDYEERHWDLME